MIKKDTWNGQEVTYSDGRVLFKTRYKFLNEDIEQILNDYTLLCFEPLIEDVNLYLVEVVLQDNQSTLSLCNELNNTKDIIWAEPDLLRYVSCTTKFPNDPLLDNQWYINRVGVPIAWERLNGIDGNENVFIAVLDTGIQLDSKGKLSHPDLKSSRIVLEANFEDPPKSLNDVCGHGTHVAGIVGADTNNNTGVAGINWASPLHIYKVATKYEQDKPCSGQVSSFTKAVASALNHALAYKLNVVINYSFGNPTTSLVEKEAIQLIDNFNTDNLGTSQVILCASAGNKGQTPPSYPANYSAKFPNSVVCIGSCGKNNTTSDFSNYGSSLTILAPGEGILSTYIDSKYITNNGTSMATPIVSGIASLIWSQNKSLSAKQVINTLKKYAVKLGKTVPDPHWGHGIVTALWDDQCLAFQLSFNQGEETGATKVTLKVNTFN